MGKKMTKKQRARRREVQRKTMRVGVLAALVLAGVGIMAGMAAYNGNAKPNRDMRWYLQEGAVEVAAPASGEGFETTDGPVTTTDGVSYVTANYVTAQSAQTAERFAAPSSGAGDYTLPVVDEQPADVGQGGEYMLPEDEAEMPQAEDAPLTGEAQPAQEETQPADEAAGDAWALPADEAEEAVPDGPVTLTITAVGDCTLGGTVGSKGAKAFVRCVEKYGYDYFFEKVRDIFEADDLTIVNLEGALTDSNKASKHGSFVFKAPTEYVHILTGSSIELCNVANNHSMDYGMNGLKDTARVLEDNGIGCCGFTKAWSKKIKGIRVTALGFTKWNHTVEQIQQAVAAAREDCDLLIVNIHWGVEGHYKNDAKQTEMGHAAIDAGADLVIGTHPHVYQGIEKYKDKYIVYSLGNFCFGGNSNPPDKRCLIFQQTFSFTPGMGIAQAGLLDEGINLIPAVVSSVSTTNDFQPMVLSAEQGAQVLAGVAKSSTNFSVEGIRWMKDNYLLANGLIKSDGEDVIDDLPTVADADLPEVSPDAMETEDEEFTGEIDLDADFDASEDAEDATDAWEDAPEGSETV